MAFMQFVACRVRPLGPERRSIGPFVEALQGLLSLFLGRAVRDQDDHLDAVPYPAGQLRQVQLAILPDEGLNFDGTHGSPPLGSWPRSILGENGGRGACMRKLLMIACGVLKHRAPFDPSWARKLPS